MLNNLREYIESISGSKSRGSHNMLLWICRNRILCILIEQFLIMPSPELFIASFCHGILLLDQAAQVPPQLCICSVMGRNPGDSLLPENVPLPKVLSTSGLVPLLSSSSRFSSFPQRHISLPANKHACVAHFRFSLG